MEYIFDYIYDKYPCIKEASESSGILLCTLKDACRYLLKSDRWIDYLTNIKTVSNKNIVERYKDIINEYGVPAPFGVLYLSKLSSIDNKIRNNKSLSSEDKKILNYMAKLLGISSKNYNNIMDKIYESNIKFDILSIVYEDEDVQESLREFLIDEFSNLCFLPKSEYDIKNPNVKESLRLLYSTVDQENPFDNMTLSRSYITDLLDDNLSITFPGIYKNSKGELEEEEKINFTNYSWDNKPMFPKYAMVIAVTREKYLLTNFVASKRGFNSIENIPDYDVYGQLICSNKAVRSTGLGKLLLLSTVLMAKLFKVNYVFIQAFQGVLGVQAPLYNRIGFNFYFSNDILKRKTAFYQWSLVDEEQLDSEYDKYQNSGYDLKYFLKKKLMHLTFLQPMWIDIKNYDTRQVCNFFNKGFDYQTLSTGKMTSGIRKIYDMSRRLIGFDINKGEDEEKISPEIRVESSRKKDKEYCVNDDECLSDYCLNNICRPYPYMKKTIKEKIREFANVLSGYDINDYSRLKNKNYEDLIELNDNDQDIKEKIREISREQDYIIRFANIFQEKEEQELLSEKELSEFKTRQTEYYNKLSKDKLYYNIAKGLLTGVTETIKGYLLNKDKKEMKEEELIIYKKPKLSNYPCTYDIFNVYRSIPNCQRVYDVDRWFESRLACIYKIIEINSLTDNIRNQDLLYPILGSFINISLKNYILELSNCNKNWNELFPKDFYSYLLNSMNIYESSNINLHLSLLNYTINMGEKWIERTISGDYLRKIDTKKDALCKNQIDCIPPCVLYKDGCINNERVKTNILIDNKPFIPIIDTDYYTLYNQGKVTKQGKIERSLVYTLLFKNKDIDLETTINIDDGIVLREAYDIANNILKDFNLPISSSIFLTGFEYGGTISIVASYILIKKGYQIHNYNFGSFRCGDERFVKYIENSSKVFKDSCSITKLTNIIKDNTFYTITDPITNFPKNLEANPFSRILCNRYIFNTSPLNIRSDQLEFESDMLHDLSTYDSGTNKILQL